ncbi:MAG: hypothetical protein EI684_13370 [Candidatus Viridilinea halotolerans]|uniref:Uncharacterized protein n=1 Tax=Candidatus Viridilinea halotolerans TaxID=2491704 RepID=A0A426TXD8_9CHLR|nr:MAG: hypothetical protein EI684_13370 [Candidatus Viridilinea halotolerans]
MTTTSDYVICLSVRDFCAALRDGLAETCYAQVTSHPVRFHGIAMEERQRLILSASVTISYPNERLIYAASVDLDHCSLLGSDAEQARLRAAMQDRTDTLLGHLREWFGSWGIAMRQGIRLVPGLWDDLVRFNACPDLWRLVNSDPHDPHARRVEWLDMPLSSDVARLA